MRGVKYSRGYKGVLVVLEHIFILIFVLCFGVGIVYTGSNDNFFDIMRRKTFVESGQFSEMVQKDIHDIVKYAVASSNFEKDGSYAPDKLVDIMEYHKNGRIDGKISEGVGYTMEELYNWSRNFQYDYKTIYVCEKSDETYDYYEKKDFEKLQEQDKISKEYYDGYDRSDYGAPEKESTDKKRVYERVWQLQGLKEKYKAVVDNKGTRMGLLELAAKNPDVNGHLSDYFNAIESTLEDFQNEIVSYKETKGKYAENATNLSFFYYDDWSDNVCTNTPYTNKDDMDIFMQKAKDSGRYLIFNSKELDLDTNINYSQRELLNYGSEVMGSRKGNNTLIIHLDTSFPVKDGYQTAASQYERLQPWFKMLVGAGIIGLLGFLISLIELTLRAGRMVKDGAIELNWFDRIKTEIALAVIAVLVILVIMFFEAVGPWQTYDVWTFTVIGIDVAVINALMLIGYLSVVRRIKAKTFWSNSILAMFASAVKGLFLNRKITTRILISYLAFLILNFFLLASGIGVFLAIILDVSVGISIMKNAVARKEILNGVQRIAEGNLEYKINTFPLKGDNRKMAEAVNSIGDGLHNAVDASMKNERLKTDLITNVSHDIKTPLTSIINYIDLLKRENIEDERVRGYIEVLNNKAQRLKNLTEDLVEASKISSGNVKIEFTRLNFVELVNQTAGEFSEKFEARDLELIMQLPDRPAVIMADGRRLWRVLENLYNNVAKYAMQGTRVYADLRITSEFAEFSIKNISEQPLNINADELTERFIRGDVSRSTEGSGLGLSIAKNLTELQRGQFIIYLDGDLFKVTVRFPLLPPGPPKNGPND